MTQRKCSECGEWNGEEDYCSNCGNLISLTKQIEIEHAQKVEQRINKTPDKLDNFIDAFEHSRFFLIRFIYRVLYSVWLGFIAILSFFLYILAWGPG